MDDGVINPGFQMPDEEGQMKKFSDLRQNSIIPTCVYTWTNINVYASIMSKGFCGLGKREEYRKHILKGVSGEAKPGQLVALMGASGAGKTTLLNVLTGRNLHQLHVTGNLEVNGKPVAKTLTSISAYVQQDDLFIGTLTIREQLIFQAMLRMSKNHTYEERLKRVDNVIAELGLKKCENTIIGIPGRIKGVSGGEKKRLSFGCEVLTNPSLMFCDEPTSGLDSFMAEHVVKVLSEMARNGRTIVCTIHQPSSEVFALFDHLYLLANGRLAYTGRSDQALQFFSGLGWNCPVNYNPADFFIHTLAVVPEKEEECLRKVQHICDQFHETEVSRSFQAGRRMERNLSIETAEHGGKSMYKASWIKQFRAVMWRSYLSLKREPLLTKVRFIQTIIVALLFGTIYWRQTLNQEAIMNFNGVLFLLLTNMSFQNMFAVINVFCAEMPIFLREHWNGMYRTDVYFLSKSLVELPLFLAIPFMFVTLVYWMVGLNEAVDKFFICVAIVILVANVSCSFGYLISAVSSDINMAMSLGAPLLTPFMLFGGLFLNNDSIPVYYVWIKYLSWFYYGNEALLVNQWRDVTNITSSSNTVNSTIPHITEGWQVLKQLNFEVDYFERDLGLLVALLFIYRLIAFGALLIRSRSRK